VALTLSFLSKLDIDDKGDIDKKTAISELEKSGVATYDSAREALKSVNDSSGRVDRAEWVRINYELGKAKQNPL
jgi:plastin-1